MENIKALEDKCLELRSKTDYRLPARSYILIMIDGRAFSSFIKHHFELPFSDTFINMMNEVAIYVCNELSGCKFAYTQSDEVSFLVTDFDTEKTSSFFDNRLNKIQSVVASLATAKFNQLMLMEELKKKKDKSTDDVIRDMKLSTFDCKAWTVPSSAEVYEWFVFRQSDNLRNARSNHCRFYLSAKQMHGAKAKDLCEKIKNEKGVDFDTAYSAEKKYGRFIYKEDREVENEYGKFIRKKFVVHDGFVFREENNKKIFMSLFPKKEEEELKE